MNPIFVLAAAPGDEYAIWQVETDNEPGDLTGAWLVTPEGVEGYAKDLVKAGVGVDPGEPGESGLVKHALRTILRFPTLVAGDPAAGTATREAGEVEVELRELGVEIIDWPATETAADAALAEARETFAEQIGGRQPAWGMLKSLSDLHTQLPQPLANPAAEQALTAARALQEWLRAWHEFDKLRARRLHSEVTGVPLQYQS